ncbi:phage gene 29 protein family protein [Corynebacterium amycolatum]|uniref:phage gene 29 protein family protein n=1 Tax=Corynebacterium amycolatum TaxID=43765 RepID=UPI002119E1FD|nr:DUF2744 domain-containing protein [Corynebacterium amycolatum]MCQ9167498.1 DUF2744 domain-containing protein [Corynebacterium amycolatum]MCQ9173747.1 DUF2744 domain-containing protein [Corynebacterium amycolatum]
MSLPTLETTYDKDDPTQFMLWAWVKLTTGKGDFGVPEETAAELSQIFWRRGFRHHPELQMEFYKPPFDGAGWWQGQAGLWLPADEPGVPPEDVVSKSAGDIDVIMAALTPEQKTAIRKKLHEEGQ